jgi:beta-N-acetylhexosaminidase
MSSLSIPVAAGQVLVAGFPAGDPPRQLSELAQSGALGGFILFSRNLGSPMEVAALTQRLRGINPAGPPLWIAIDQEGGRVARLRAPVLTLPAARVLGDLDDVNLTEEAGTLLGHQLGWLGVNLDFAPVLDVDTNPANPVIGDRSYGSDVARVVRHARAFAMGLARAGVASCGKHFPGHGDTRVDSHFELPRLEHDEARLRRVELAPFAALARELPCIMTAHVVFDAWDPSVPATLSRRVITGLLRGELGFTGLVWSDDLEMKAIVSHYGLDDAACEAIEAGCDCLLVCSNVESVLRAHDGLVRRAERDGAFASRLRLAAERSIAARKLHGRRAVEPQDIDALLRQPSGAELEARIARA